MSFDEIHRLEARIAQLEKARELGAEASATLRDESIAKSQRIARLEADLAQWNRRRSSHGVTTSDCPYCRIGALEAALRRWVPLSSPFTDEQMDERVEWQRDHALAFAGTSLDALLAAACEGLDGSPGDAIAAWAVLRIRTLEAALREIARFTNVPSESSAWSVYMMVPEDLRSTSERSAESDGSLQELRQFAHYIDERLIAVERQLENFAEPK